MSSPKFTPGPWVADETGDVHTTTGKGRKVAETFDENGVPYLGRAKGTEEQALANAHLIASAPDLYAALQAVIGDGHCDLPHPASQDYVAKSAIVKVRAALAKADGRTP